MIAALCGGVGGAKLVRGLYRSVPPETLSVIVNTADDVEMWGLRVSPDLDTVMYTLAGLAQIGAGWGIEGDTLQALGMLRTYGAPSWFHAGDRDLGTDIYRTWRLESGASLTAVTDEMRKALGVRAAIIPMTDQPVATRLHAEEGWIDFQEYFVHRRHQVSVDGIRYDGAETASPASGIIQVLQAADAVVIVNSNPVLSILPILAVPDIREALQQASGARVAVSPMIGTGSVAGPAGDLMGLVGQAATSAGVAALYAGLIDGIVISERDCRQRAAIEALGIAVLVTDTLMRDEADKDRLARETLDFARSLR